MSAIILQFGPMSRSNEPMPNRLRHLRETRKVSQQVIADLMHVSKMTVSDLERGKIQLNVDYMARLARIFGVAPVDLLNEEDQNEFLRAEEMELLRLYRLADPVQREMIHRVAEVRNTFAHQDEPARGEGVDRARDDNSGPRHAA